MESSSKLVNVKKPNSAMIGIFVSIPVTDFVFDGSEPPQIVPVPDVRKEMEALNKTCYAPFYFDGLDEDPFRTVKIFGKYHFYWTFLEKQYILMDYSNCKIVPFSNDLSFLHTWNDCGCLTTEMIKQDLFEAKKKFKSIIDKYNAIVMFGVSEWYKE